MVATSDLDKEVVVDYAAIHCGLTNEVIEDYDWYPSKEEMVKDLTDKRLGYDFQKDKPYDWTKLAKKADKTKGIEKYWLADQLSKNLGDIMKIKSLPETDMLFYSSPCTDISAAGKQEGVMWTCLDCGEQYNPNDYDVKMRYTCPHCGSHNIKSTRSGLLFEVERLLVDYQSRDCLPKYLCLENVSALVSKKFIKDFEAWVDRLDNLGYNTYWQIINAKDTGTPQSRERVFALSIRKDIDTGKFEFPKPFDSGIRLRDVLEDDINIISKYFLSDEVQSRLKITNPNFDTSIIGTTKPDFRTIGERDVVYQKDGICGCLMASDYKQPKQLYVGNDIEHVGTLYCPGWGHVDVDVVSDNGIIPCLQTHNRHNVAMTENKPVQSGTLMGKYEKMMDVSRRVYDENGISPTLHTCSGGNTEPKVSRNNLKVVRKLTPKETFRLQAFDDIDYERCKEVGMSDTQGYKATGNSICVSVLKLLFEHLYKAQYNPKYECYDEKVLKYQEEMKHTPNYVSDITRVGNVSTNNSQGGAVYGIDGVSQTICAGPYGYGTGNIYDDREVADNKPVLVGGIGEQNFGKQFRQGNRVYDADNVAMALMSQPVGNTGGNSYLYATEVYGAASRGRYNEDGKVEQHLEINSSDYSNCLTSVQKDSLIVEVEKENFMNLPVE